MHVCSQFKIATCRKKTFALLQATKQLRLLFWKCFGLCIYFLGNKVYFALKLLRPFWICCMRVFLHAFTRRTCMRGQSKVQETLLSQVTFRHKRDLYTIQFVQCSLKKKNEIGSEGDRAGVLLMNVFDCYIYIIWIVIEWIVSFAEKWENYIDEPHDRQCKTPAGSHCQCSWMGSTESYWQS